MLSDIVRFSKWLRRRSPHATTARNYSGDIKLFLAWAQKPPPKITVRDVDAFIDHCLIDCGHSPTTINRRLAAIRTFYKFLDLESDQVLPCPVLSARHYIRQGQRLPRDVENADVDQLFTVIESVRDRAMYILMLRCGLRVSEVCALSLGDLYLHPTPGSLPRLWVRDKGEVQRVVYLSGQALDALDAWIVVRPRVESDAVFVSRFRRRLKVNTVQVTLGRYCRKAGVWITCHQLRHCFARNLVEVGMPVVTLQQLMGHARIRTTQLYVKVSNRKVQADYEAAIAEVVVRFPLDGNGGAR